MIHFAHARLISLLLYFAKVDIFTKLTKFSVEKSFLCCENRNKYTIFAALI